MEEEKKEFCVTKEEEKKEFWYGKELKTDWYAVCSILGLFIIIVIISCVLWPLSMDVLNSGTIVVARCAVVVCIGVFGLTILFLLVFLVAMIDSVLKNRRSGFIAYLELEVERDWINRNETDGLFLMPILIVLGLYGIREGLRISSPNSEHHQEISNDHLAPVLFSLCLLTSSVSLHLLFSGGLLIACRIVPRMRTTVTDNTLEKLEMVYRVLPKAYLALNMIVFLGLYTYSAWPIHMKFGIFAAYFFSFFGLLVIVVLTELIHDEGKLVGSLAWSWKNLVESPGWKNTGGWKNVDNTV